MDGDDQRQGFRIEELNSDSNKERRNRRNKVGNEKGDKDGSGGQACKNRGEKWGRIGGVGILGNEKLSHFQTGHFLHLWFQPTAFWPVSMNVFVLLPLCLSSTDILHSVLCEGEIIHKIQCVEISGQHLILLSLWSQLVSCDIWLFHQLQSNCFDEDHRLQLNRTWHKVLGDCLNLDIKKNWNHRNLLTWILVLILPGKCLSRGLSSSISVKYFLSCDQVSCTQIGVSQSTTPRGLILGNHLMLTSSLSLAAACKI